MIAIIYDKGTFERFAARELQHFLPFCLSKKEEITISPDATLLTKKASRIVLVSRPDNPVLTEAFRNGSFAKQYKTLENEGFILFQHKDKLGKLIIVAARKPMGIVYGCYELLEHLGMTFSFGWHIPPKRKCALALKKNLLVQKPRFAIRGTRHFTNFLCGPWAWTEKEYKAYLDNLLRIKGNLFYSNVYPFEPFDPFCENPIWTPYCDKDDIYIGKKYFTKPMGNRAVGKTDNLKERQQHAISSMQNVLKYAHSKGIETALATEFYRFEKEKLADIPLQCLVPTDEDRIWAVRCFSNQKVKNLIHKKLEAFLEAYPDLDYLVLAQAECGFPARSFEPCPCAECTITRKEMWETMTWGKDEKFIPGDWAYAQGLKTAVDIVRKICPDIKIATDGFLVEHIFYTLNDIIPQDVIFNSLVEYDVLWGLDRLRMFRDIDRKTWASSWFEFDGRVWLLEPKVRPSIEFFNKALLHQVNGVVMTHWRTHDIDENVRLFAKATWQENITEKSFYTDYATRKYHPSDNKDILKALKVLEDHEEFLVGSARAANFGLTAISMDYGIPPAFRELPSIETALQGPKGYAAGVMGMQVLDWAFHARKMEKELAALIPQSRKYLAKALKLLEKGRANVPGGGDRARYERLINRVEFYLLYLKVYEMMAKVHGDYLRGIEDASNRYEHFAHALQTARDVPVEKLIKTYMQFIEGPDDRGILAALNTKVMHGVKQAIVSLESALKTYAKSR